MCLDVFMPRFSVDSIKPLPLNSAKTYNSFTEPSSLLSRVFALEIDRSATCG